MLIKSECNESDVFAKSECSRRQAGMQPAVTVALAGDLCQVRPRDELGDV